MVESFVLPIMWTNEELQFLQDGAPPDSVFLVRVCLDTHFTGGRIGRRGPTERPPRDFSSYG